MVSSTRKARHRLVAAGVDGADRHRLAAGPFQHLGGRPRYCVSSSGKRACRTGTRCASGRRRRRSRCRGASTSDGSAMLTSTRTGVPALSRRACRGSLRPCRAARRKSRKRCAKRSNSSADGPRTIPPCSASSRATPASRWSRSAEPDHHRHAARARQHRDMTGGAARLQRDAAASELQSVSRKRVGAMSPPNRIAPCRRGSRRIGRQRAQHLVANVA